MQTFASVTTSYECSSKQTKLTTLYHLRM